MGIWTRSGYGQHVSTAIAGLYVSTTLLRIPELVPSIVPLTQRYVPKHSDGVVCQIQGIICPLM